MAFPKLPLDSEPIIVNVGWHPILCIAIGLLALIPVLIVALKILKAWGS